MSQIVPYLSQQTFFITGSTGFLGKVLLAKLFTVCPDLKEGSVYVLVRGKKEMVAKDRFVKDVFSDSIIFQDLLKRNPNIPKAIKVVDGDVSKSKLGLSPSDYEEICNNATCILHMAATTNFTENLRLAFEINVMGTKRVVDMAKSVKNLISMVYVSTCYTNCIRHGSTEVREKVYPINFDPYDVLKKILEMTPEEAHKATPHLIGSFPNTYTFSKMIAEHIILEEKKNLPLSIIRPSIIGGAYSFPYPGWVDSFLGAAGIVSAVGLGLLHFVIGVGTNVVDLIPVDYVVNTILAISYHTATNPPGDRMAIYHCATSSRNPFYWDAFRQAVVGYFQRNPSKRAVGGIWALFVKNPSVYWTTHLAFTKFPAHLADTKRWIKGQPPKMVAGSRTLYKVVTSLAYFILHTWYFGTHNYEAVRESLNAVDSEMFQMDVSLINWEIWNVHFCGGIKKYIFKEEDEIALPKSKL